jgi:large subunit ribosomal protein L23
MATNTDNQRTRGPKLEAHQVILRPVVTEKTTHLSTRNERRDTTTDAKGKQKQKPVGNAYSFEVNRWATKTEIKAAAEELFNVKVEKVRTQNRLGKHRRYRFRMGQLPNWKKAIIVVTPDSPPIEFF